jgi:hypothetical protein
MIPHLPPAVCPTKARVPDREEVRAMNIVYVLVVLILFLILLSLLGVL